MAELKMISPGIQVRDGKRGKSIRYFAYVNGSRETATSRIPYSLAVNPRTHKPSKVLCDDYAAWVVSLHEKAGVSDEYGRRTPTIDELVETYELIANKRRCNPLFGKPGEKAIYTAVNNFKRCVSVSGLTGTRPVTELFNRDKVKEIFNALGRQMRAISAWSMIVSLKSVTASWTLEEYESRGFNVEPPRLPQKPIQANAPQYRMLTKELRDQIDAWYLALSKSNDETMYLAASMTYQLAVRPIDTGCLTAENFKVDPSDGRVHIIYRPHKTEMSSGRVVNWPVLPALWELIRHVAGDRLDAGKSLINSPRTTYGKLNRSMRDAVPALAYTNKAVYELRKLCVDTVRRTMGADYAVALSGDRRDTIDKYYSDPYTMVGVKPMAIGPMSGAQGVESA